MLKKCKQLLPACLPLPVWFVEQNGAIEEHRFSSFRLINSQGKINMMY